MKKLCVVLALLTLLQCAFIPVHAAEETTVPTEAPTEPGSEFGQVSTVTEFGTGSVLTGCRTIDGQVPLGGSERILQTCQAAFIYEENTGTVLHSYNPDMAMSPGALTMIVTAIIAIEKGNLGDQVTISSKSYKTLPAGARNAKLKEGEVMTLRDLLYCMILTSANDAALSIAEHIAGSETSFVIMMNEYAKSVGCQNTVFVNCHGQENSNQHTTARDLVRITEYAMRNSVFQELFGATAYTVPDTNKSEKRSLKSTNYLIEQTIVPKFNYKDCTGGKESYSAQTGAHIVCTGERNGLSLIGVILGSNRKFKSNGYTVEYYGNFEEAMELLEFGLANYKVCRLLHDGQSMTQFTVMGGENQVVGQTHTTMDAVLPKDARLNNLILKYATAGGGLTAPIAMDQRIGTMEVWYRNSCIAETELYAMSSVRSQEESPLDIQSNATRDDSSLSGVLSFLGVILLIIAVPVAAYLFINNLRRTIARNRRRKRRRSRRRSR